MKLRERFRFGLLPNDPPLPLPAELIAWPEEWTEPAREPDEEREAA